MDKSGGDGPTIHPLVCALSHSTAPSRALAWGMGVEVPVEVHQVDRLVVQKGAKE